MRPQEKEGFPAGSDSKESACNVEDPGSIPESGRSAGGGHGNSLQHSCLENPMDRRAWQATAHGVAKSQTRLSGSARHRRIKTWSLIQCNPTPHLLRKKRKHNVLVSFPSWPPFSQRNRPPHTHIHTHTHTHTHTAFRARYPLS